MALLKIQKVLLLSWDILATARIELNNVKNVIFYLLNLIILYFRNDLL